MPVFDGHRPSTFQFLRACERARGMVPRNQEPQLVKLLMNELRGYAFLAVEDSEVLTLSDFEIKLRNVFGPGKTVNEYKGELATVFQRPREDILDSIDRVRDLRIAIMNGERCDYGLISPDVQDAIDWETMEAFVKGLPHEIYLRVKVVGYHSLEDAYRQAVKATGEFKRANDRLRYHHPVPPNNYDHNGARPPNNNRPNAPRQNTMTCNYCKKPGHLIKDCHTFKARVDAGIIVPYTSRQPGNQMTPSRREQGEPRRGHAVNRPRVQVATRRPRPHQ